MSDRDRESGDDDAEEIVFSSTDYHGTVAGAASNFYSSPPDQPPDILKSILLDINCKEQVEVFQDHDIDLDAALLLTDEDLMGLFPKIGQRLKFKHKIEIVKRSLTSEEVQDKENVLPVQTPRTDSPALPVIYVDNYQLETCPKAPNTSETNTNNRKETNRASLDGRAVLREGQIEGGILKEGSRRKLSQLLIAHILEKNSSKVIDSEEFHSLSSEICQLFNKESAVVFYSPYSASIDGVKKKNASGKLYETYISRRRKLRVTGDLPKSNRSSSSVSSSSSSSISLTEVEDNQENISWLKNNVEPFPMVQKKWKETEGIRLNKIKAGEGRIEDYFNDFPALKLQQGYTLLLQDFETLYPGKETNLFSKILLKKEEILKYAKAKLKVSRDKFVTERLRDLLSLVDDANPETSTNVALMVLPLVINVSPGRGKRNLPCKPSRAETSQGFVAHATNEGDVPGRGKRNLPCKPSRAEISQGFVAHATNECDVTTIIIERKDKMKKLGRTVQPYVIFVGSSEVKVKKAYVVINDTLYHFQKLITAVDCAFKVFQATGAYYPEEAEVVWTVLQIGFYEIKTKFDRKTQAVNVVLADLGLTD